MSISKTPWSYGVNDDQQLMIRDANEDEIAQVFTGDDDAHHITQMVNMVAESHRLCPKQTTGTDGKLQRPPCDLLKDALVWALEHLPYARKEYERVLEEMPDSPFVQMFGEKTSDCKRLENAIEFLCSGSWVMTLDDKNHKISRVMDRASKRLLIMEVRDYFYDKLMDKYAVFRNYVADYSILDSRENKLLEKCNRLLEQPPRNCDVYNTPEAASEAFHKFCRGSTGQCDDSCKYRAEAGKYGMDCKCRWLFDEAAENAESPRT